MTKKRKRWPNLDQKLERPWCYYCERDFDDLKILISHQKAKHFKCERCGRRLNTAGGLAVHMNQVHKENLSQVENAMSGRSSLDVEIFGMEGVPSDVLEAHNNDVTRKHFEEEAERARITGNPIRGAFTNGQAPPTKRPNIKESLEDIESRLAKYREDRKNGIKPVKVKPESKLEPVPAAAQVPGSLPSQPSPFAPGQSFAPPGAPQFPPGQYPPGNLPPGFPAAFNGPPPSFPPGAGPMDGVIPARPGSGPPGTGLPQRPPFAPPGAVSYNPNPSIDSSLEELISSANAANAAPEAPPEKKSKKEKNIRLVYSDEFVSPEEKMAGLERYQKFLRT